MKFSVTGRQVDVGESFQTYVQDQFAQINERYNLSPVDVNIVLSREAHLYRCDIATKVGRVQMRSQGNGTEVYPAFDEALRTLLQKMRRHKSRLDDHHKHHDVHYNEEMAPHYVLNSFSNHDEDTEALAPAIIAETKLELPTLSLEDAVMRLDLSGESAFIFRHSKHGKVNVVYFRADGNIGWVDPE
ncbi:MAG: ribosome-associated translation inhibitor RaiA [Caedimonadaceae bacterium]|nr:MAG: ribosome-associated translation inhibitor RaiA [Caedimonadaceae bacterium]